MNWSYIAGFFDGEGYVSWNSPGSIIVGMCQKDSKVGRHVMESIQEFLALQGIDSKLRLSTSPSRCAELSIRMERRVEIAKFAHRILPHLIVKKAPLQDLLRQFVLLPARGGKRIPIRFSMVKKAA